jgi:ABC-type multidrug transport system ATPase subunit
MALANNSASPFVACFKKTWKVQLRHSKLGVLAVVISPLLATIILWLAQVSMKQATHLDRYRCGCKCMTHEEDLCIEYDEESCGLLFSTAEQAPYCDVKQPPLWPAVLQVSPGTVGNASFLYTGDHLDLVGGVMEQMLMTPAEVSERAASAFVSSLVLEGLDDYVDQYMTDVEEFVDTTGALTRGLYDFGVVIGTSSPSSDHQLLMEGAFVPNEAELYVLLSDKEHRKYSSESMIVGEISHSISNLTGKVVQPVYTRYIPYETADEMRLDLGSPSTLGGFDWHETDGNRGLTVDIYLTGVLNSDNPSESVGSSAVRWAQSINIALNAYLRRFNQSSVVLAGVKDMPRKESVMQIDFSILLSPLLTVWIMHVVLPIELYHLVNEKEYGLKVYQYMNGMRPGIYYLATCLVHFLIYAGVMSGFAGLGYTFGIKMWALNNFSIQMVFWILWGLVIVPFGFLLAGLFKEKRSVILLSVFYVLISGFLANVFLVLFVEQEMHGVVITIQSLVPSFCAFRGLYELASYAFLADQTGSHGLQWSTLRDDPGMLIVLIQLTFQGLVISMVAFYVERDWLLRFEKKSNPPTKSQEKKKTSGAKMDEEDDALDLYLGNLNSGVQFEKKISSSDQSSPAVVKRDSSMGYYYYGGANAANKSSITDQSSIETTISVAFQGVKKWSNGINIPYLSIHCGEIFTFLTDDHASASALLNMIQGLSPYDEGTIMIHGRDSKDMIRQFSNCVGVVLDSDILFDDLTGMEHLTYYAQNRLHQAADIDRYIQKVIEILELHSSIDKRVSKYSSGMKRRLSLAISLLGYPDEAFLPQILLMHEPAKSMDPYSRKVLWRALSDLKEKLAIVIATCSVSEAESSDRIAVIKDGAPMFIGSPQYLVFKQGRFVFVSFIVEASSKNLIVKFVRQNLNGAEIVQNWAQKLKFKVPVSSGDESKEDQTIDSIFRAIERAKIGMLEGIILDYSVYQCNLEDVFVELVS